MEILLILLPTLGTVLLFLSGVFSGDTAGSFFLALCGVFMFIITIGLVSDAACEKTLTKYVNGEVTYDTVTLDKDGKLLEIKIKDN